MKRYLTLNFVLIVIFAIVLFAMGYSLHRIKLSFTQTIVERYTQEIHSDITQLRLNLQSIINDSSDNTMKTLPNFLKRYITIHPITRRMQLMVAGELVADTSIHPNTRLPHHTACLPIGALSLESVMKGVFCYTINIRVYKNGQRVPAILYLYLDKNRLTTDIENELRRMMLPVGIVMLVVVLLTAILLYLAIIRNFSRLIRWSDDPSRKPPEFLIVEFYKISQKMHAFAKKLIDQFESLKAALSREGNLRSIMHTVARINELLVSEKDEERFLQKACDILSAHRNYFATTIFLKEEDGTIYPATSIMTIDDSDTKVAKGSICLPNDRLADLEHSHTGFFVSPISQLGECTKGCISIDLPQVPKKAWIGVFALRHDIAQESLGYLVINTVTPEGFDAEEVEMLGELAGDIGFALHAFRREKKFRTLLYTNPLTQLPNAAAFKTQVEDHIGAIIAVANIDRFKSINTLYGMKIADEILRQTASLLRKLVPSDLQLFHYLGDEFILLFPKSTTKAEAETFLSKILAEIEAHIFAYEGVEILLSLRFGVTTLQDELSLRECHVALQEAKIRHNPIQWYTPSMSELVKEDSIQTYRLVKNALEEGRVTTYFQGIFTPGDPSKTYYESLLRIEMEDGSLLSPFKFIDFIKQTRLYPMLSRIVFDRVIEAIEKLHSPISINLSVIDIQSDDFCHYIYERLETAKLAAPVIFEILESENIENYEKTAEFIRTVKSYGCKIAIDDFGSGYANFQYIARLDVDILKIDGSLIQHIVHDEHIRAIVRRINEIAHDLGMKTVAEFVANEMIYDVVIELGIDAVQGFYLHKPSPLSTIEHRQDLQ
jgi:diguanylate cyclase (GGDEF)-like protein